MKTALLLSGLGAAAGSFTLLSLLAVLNALGPGAPAQPRARGGHALPPGRIAAAVPRPHAQLTRFAEGG